MKSNLNWICVYTNVRMEIFVFNQIKDLGLDVYLPKYKKSVSNARKIIDKIYPLFPRYLFVKILTRESFSKIKNLRGVSDFIKNDSGIPHKVSSDIIDSIKSRENSEGYINYLRFYEGQNIKITKRNFINLRASFLKKICKDKAKVLIELLGREHPIITPYSSIDQIN